MKKTLDFTCERTRTVLRHGTRAALYFARELPLGDSALARHAREMAQALLAHAERVWLVEAANELERFAEAGRGFAFRPHHILFTAHVCRAARGVCMTFSLRYTAGERERLCQQKKTYWTADGAYRQKRGRIVKNDAL